MTPPITQYEQDIAHKIEQFGCHITHVFDPDGDEPAFSYSTGFLKSVGQPELIVFGLTSEMMAFMINEVWRQCKAGLELTDGLTLTGLLSGHRCIARNVHPSQMTREYFNSAMWWHRNRTGEGTLSAVQIVWPGALDGLFPWDNGCAAEVREWQPPLYEARLNS